MTIFLKSLIFAKIGGFDGVFAGKWMVQRLGLHSSLRSFVPLWVGVSVWQRVGLICYVDLLLLGKRLLVVEFVLQSLLLVALLDRLLLVGLSVLVALHVRPPDPLVLLLSLVVPSIQNGLLEEHIAVDSHGNFVIVSNKVLKSYLSILCAQVAVLVGGVLFEG